MCKKILFSLVCLIILATSLPLKAGIFDRSSECASLLVFATSARFRSAGADQIPGPYLILKRLRQSFFKLADDQKIQPSIDTINVQNGSNKEKMKIASRIKGIEYFFEQSPTEASLNGFVGGQVLKEGDISRFLRAMGMLGGWYTLSAERDFPWFNKYLIPALAFVAATRSDPSLYSSHLDYILSMAFLWGLVGDGPIQSIRRWINTFGGNRLAGVLKKLQENLSKEPKESDWIYYSSNHTLSKQLIDGIANRPFDFWYGLPQIDLQSMHEYGVWWVRRSVEKQASKMPKQQSVFSTLSEEKPFQQVMVYSDIAYFIDPYDGKRTLVVTTRLAPNRPNFLPGAGKLETNPSTLNAPTIPEIE